MTTRIIPSKKARLFLQSLKTRGALATLQVTLSYCIDYLFDLKYRTDTCSQVEFDALGVDDTKKEHSERYQSTHAIPLRKLLRALEIPPGRIIVDLGCGKGKVLLIASEFGFEEVRGIEFSPSLCDIARKNWSTYKARTNTKTNFVIVESDVLDYGMRDDEDVFFLFNPFDAYILKQVLQNILASLQRRKRTIWIIYYNAVHREIVEECIGPTTLLEFSYWGEKFLVFEVEQGAASDRNSAALQVTSPGVM